MGLFVGIGIVIILGLINLIIYIFKTQAREKLKKQYSDYARRNGLKYYEAMDGTNGFYDRDFRRMRNMGHTPSRECNILGVQGDIEYSWGIYHYLTTEIRTRHNRRRRGFSSSSTYKHVEDHYINYCLVICPYMNIPYFFARDESMILDSIGSIFGGQDIDFKEDSAFSSSFVLQGDKEDRIRRAFTPEVRKLFTTLSGKGYTFEGYGEAMLILGGKDDLKERVELSKTAIRIANAFIKNSSQQRPNANAYDDTLNFPTEINNVNKKLNPHMYEQMNYDGFNERIPLQSAMPERQYNQQNRQTQPVRGVIQTGFRSGSKSQTPASNGYNQQNNYNQQPNRYNQQKNNYNSQPDQQDNNNQQPDTNISDLKGKPALMEILKNRENKQ